MAKVVYTDHDRSAPYVSFHGVAFTHGQDVEIEDHRVELLDMAEANPFFTVTERAAPRGPDQSAGQYLDSGAIQGPDLSSVEDPDQGPGQAASAAVPARRARRRS